MTCPTCGMPAFTCPICGMTSHNPNDAREGYCRACHDWTRQPDPPLDIRLHLHDGTVIPVEAVYIGDDQEGLHVWRVTTTIAHIDKLNKMTMRQLPPRTTVVLGVEGV